MLGQYFRFIPIFRRLIRFWTVFLFMLCPLLLVQAPVSSENANIPRILSNQDIQTYRQIFAASRDADWARVTLLTKKLENPVLAGHVSFEKLMHPTGYRSSYAELSGWMKQYSDHPNAWRVYKLATRRKGRSKAPKRPEDTRYPGVTGQAALPKPPLPRRSLEQSRAVRDMAGIILKYIRAGHPEKAERKFWSVEALDIMAPFEAADALEKIASSYYYEGNDEKAVALATYGADLAREIETETDWIAGLANWRMGYIQQAYIHFSTLGLAERAGDFLGAAGDYWAARTAYRLGNPGEATIHLKAAAERSETFYGLIAARQLGISPDLDWTQPVLDKSAVTGLLDYPAAVRSIALAEIGRDDLADEELRLLWGREGIKVQDDVLALAAHLRLPAIQLRIGRTGGTKIPAPTAVRYPLPDWAPADGLRLDRALIFAMMRQESEFGSRANSRVGAKGLLQVMPATASFISKDNSLFKNNKNRLYEPEFNMALGQIYIEKLMGEKYTEGNLLMMLAAYNGGPGSLINWKSRVDYQNDPLLFIESISFFETRHFIERVMTNLWIYRLRLGQKTPSLDALASGAWPGPEALDTPQNQAVAAERRRRLAERKGRQTDD